MSKKVLLAIFASLLMFSSVFGLIAYLPAPSVSVNATPISPSLSSVGETASTSTYVAYYTNNAVSNSATVTQNYPIIENSSAVAVNICEPDSVYSLSSGTASTTFTIITSYYYGECAIGPNILIPALEDYQNSATYGITLGSVTIKTSWTGTSSGSQTYTTDFNQYDSGDDEGYIVVPTDFSASTIYPETGSYTFEYTITLTSDSGYPATQFAPETNSGNDYNTYWVASSVSAPALTAGSDISSEPSEQVVDLFYGWHYNSISTTFSIPTYESSYDIYLSSAADSEFSYDGSSLTSPTTSYTYTGNLTGDSLSMYPVGDPTLVSSTGASTFSVSYYLEDQYQVSSASATQTASPTYTYNQVSGTTNQASASFNFGGSTPSSAVFIPYESGTTSLSTDSTSISFTPTITVQNPYYTYAQNQLDATLSGSSTGYSNTSNTASPSFSGQSVSSTSSISPSWKVNLNLYGNRHPTYDNSSISVTTVNPLTPITLYTNYTEYFSGESQVLESTWNGHALTSTSSTPNALSESSDFKSVGSKTISFYAQNDPNPSTNGLSALDSGSNSVSVNVVPFSLTPSPVDYSSVGTSILLSLAYNTQTSAKMTIINLTVNGVLEDRFQPDLTSGTVKYDFTQPVSAPLLVTWQAVDQYGYSQSISFQYGSNLTPAEYSNKVTVLQSPNATHSYQITLSGVPSGTGYYDQLLTISNTSSYGINTAGSNVQFTSGNNTLLYAWIQSINSTSMQVWVKNYYGNSVIDMQVLPSFENLFSITGYLGNVNYFNANNVFLSAWVFTKGLPDGFTISNPSGVSYNSSGVTFNSPGTYLYSNNRYSYSSDILDFYLNPHTNSTDLNGANEFQGYAHTTDSPVYSAGSWITGGFGSIIPTIGNLTTRVLGNDYTDYSGYSLYGVEWNSSNTASFYINNTFYQTLSMPNITPNPRIIFGVQQNYSKFSPLTVQYAFIREGNYNMPTFTIGTGSIFQANATTTSTFTGTSSGNYNSTYENMIYDIPIAPNTNYVTILYNSTWTVSNVYPSTFLPLINNSNFVTIEDASGFSSVQIELIEPNPFIGQLEPVSLSFNPSSVEFQTGDLNHVSYTPFGSSATDTYTTTQDFLQLPFGASASIFVTNSWDQTVGSTGNFTVTQTNSLIINATVTEISMNPLNGTISTLYVSGNGYNVSIQPQLSFYLLNNSQYKYYATIPSGNTFPIYSGTIITDSPAHTVTIYGNAPEEGLTLYQNAYNLSQSQLGENNSFSLSPFVKMFINGEAWQQGQTYDTYAGSVIEIHLETVLNQPLNFRLPLSSTLTLTSTNGYLNFTMPAFSPSYQIYITTPSYVFGIINAEQVPASSPLATQHNNVSLQSNASVNFKYETMVGQESEVYMLAGIAYHFFTHDNITNSLNFTLSNNTFYVLNGQNITLYQIYEKERQNQANVTNAVTHLQLSMLTGTGTAYPNTPLSYKFQLQWQNGTAVSPSIAKNLTYLANLVNVSSGSPLPITIQQGRSGSYFWFNFTSPASGQFDLSVIGSDTVSGVSYPVDVSQLLFIQAVAKSSVGMSESLSVPTAYTNQSFSIILYFYYGNGTLMNSTDTYLAINNTGNATLFAMSGNLKSVYGIVSIVYLAPGKAVMSLNISKAGTYELFTTTSKFQISGSNVSASALATFSVHNPLLNFWQALSQGWSNFFTAKTFETLGLAIYHELIIWIPVSLILAAIYLIYRKLKDYWGTDKADKATIDLETVGEVNNIFSAHIITGLKGFLDIYATLTENQKFAFDNAARGVLKAYPIVQYSDGKKITTITMLDVRETIQKAMGNTRIKGYFNTLRSAFMTKKKKTP